MKKSIRKVIALLSVIMIMFSNINVNASNSAIMIKNNDKPWLTKIDPISIDMETIKLRGLLQPGDAKNLAYLPTVRGHANKEFTSKAYFTLTTDFESPYEIYLKDDVTYTYLNGFKAKKGAKPLKVLSNTYEGSKNVVKYEPIVQKGVIKGDTLIEGLEFVLTAPHEARKLPDVEIQMEVVVAYDDDKHPYDPSEHKPEINIPEDGDDKITGEGYPGDEIVITDKDGNVIGKGEVDKDGNFEIDLDRPVVEGETIVVTPNTPGQKNPGPSTEVEVDESHKPKVDIPEDGDDKITGEGVPGDEIIVTDKDGNVIGKGEVDKDGNFEVELDGPVTEGETITVTPQTPGRNKPGQSTEVDVDESHKPKVDIPEDGDNKVTGEGIPGDEIIVTDKDGNVIGKGKVDKDGKFEVDLDSPLTEGETIKVTPQTPGRDKPGQSTEVEVDQSHKPKVDIPRDGDDKVTGEGIPGDEIIITDKDGNILGKGKVDKDGKFKVDLDRPLVEGEVIKVTPQTPGRDKPGQSTEVEVDNEHRPKVDTPTEGDEKITGEGYPGDEIIITDKDGNELGRGEVGEDGRFEIDLSRPLKPNESITLTVVDQNGRIVNSIEIVVQPKTGKGKETGDLRGMNLLYFSAVTIPAIVIFIVLLKRKDEEELNEIEKATRKNK